MAKGDSDRQLAEKHKYRLLNGEIAINVTAISDLMDDGKSGGMAGAAVKLTKAGLNYHTEWKARRDLGTRAHGYLESFLDRQEIDQVAGDDGYVDALERFILENDPEVIAKEEIVLSEHGYGGRFDLIAKIGGETGLIDLKSGGAHAQAHTLQLSAYRFADGLAQYDPVGNLLGLNPMPTIDWCAALYIRGDGNYYLDRYPADEEAFSIFCALLGAYKWSHSATMKALIKEAKTR